MILLLAYLNAVLWVYLLLAHGRFWQPIFLPPATAPDTWPEICAVIPARNEAPILENTLPSLLNNDYPGKLRVVLVDDGSEDGTAAVAARIGVNELLTVVRGHARAGWKGKVAAMQCGLEQLAAAPPCYVLFTDADIRYDANALTQLVAHAEAKQLALASLMVKLHCKSAAERWLIPAFVYFFQLLYPFRRVNDPACKTAAAAGGCMLVRYDALMKAGGFAPLCNALIDDCALARLLKRQGRIWLGLTQRAHSVRPYPHLSDIRSMVARSAYDQLDYSPLNLIGAVLGMVFTYSIPVLLSFFAHGQERLLGMASWAMISFSFLPTLRFYARPLLQSVMLPAIAAIYTGFTLDSAWQHARGKGGYWKGRVQATA